LRRPEDANTLDWWFEFEGVPVKWNWPIGLSFDLLTNHDPSKGPDAYAELVPWTLILHKKDYPKDRILSLDYGIETVRSYWLNQIKEVSTLMLFRLSIETDTNIESPG
jgi:autophagy-related protein 5